MHKDQTFNAAVQNIHNSASVQNIFTPVLDTVQAAHALEIQVRELEQILL